LFVKTSIVCLLLTVAAATALAEQASRTYSNIVINVVTSTNAVTFTDLRGQTYSNVTVKLIPYGLGWHAKDGSEGRLAITNLDDVNLADITGLSTDQVAYLSYKKAAEDGTYIPPEATNSTPWWLAPYLERLEQVFRPKPEEDLPPTVCNPLDRQRWREMNDQIQEMQLRSEHDMNKQVREAQERMMRDLHEQMMRELRSFSPGQPVFTKP
jgi:hypothetical protein